MTTLVSRGVELKRLLVIFLFPYLMGCASLTDRSHLKDIVDDSNVHRVISLQLETVDKHRIAATYYNAGRSKVIILAHGFFNNKDSYLFKRIVKSLVDSYDVIAFDFRGHGKSNGLFTWTTNEPRDLEEVIRYAKTHGYTQVGIMGFSLGAAVALIEASKNRDINSVIAVSAPFDFGHIDYHFWDQRC